MAVLVRDTAQRMKIQKKAKAATSCKIASSSRSGFGLVLVMGLGFRRLKECALASRTPRLLSWLIDPLTAPVTETTSALRVTAAVVVGM